MEKRNELLHTNNEPAQTDDSPKERVDLTLKDDGLFTFDNGATDALAELPEKEARRILRKVDYHLVPLLGILYLVAFMDRSNSKLKRQPLSVVEKAR